MISPSPTRSCRLLFSLKLYRNNFVITALALLSVFLFSTETSYAGHFKLSHGIAYHAQLGQDLDGDHIPETATIRQGRNVYQVSIHFTTGHPKLRLSTYLSEGIAGLSFETRDVNNDSKGDLVLLSATSTRPIAVWINNGRAKFQKASSLLFSRVGRYTGPTYRFRGASRPEPVGNIAIDPMPQATPLDRYFTINRQVVDLLTSPPEQHPFDCLLSQEPARGPPAEARA
jgi:hypothetical protein